MNKTTAIVILLFLTSSLSGCIEELTHTHDDGTTHSHPGEKNHTHTVSINNVIDDSPRVAFSSNMVNQYNSEGTWMTDLQGVSGGIPLEYCQKIWPDTVNAILATNKELEICNPLIRILSSTLHKWGEENNPVFMPFSVNVFDKIEQMVPLPLLPAT